MGGKSACSAQILAAILIFSRRIRSEWIRFSGQTHRHFGPMNGAFKVRGFARLAGSNISED